MDIICKERERESYSGSTLSCQKHGHTMDLHDDDLIKDIRTKTNMASDIGGNEWFC